MALTKKAIRTKATLLESARKLITEKGFDRVSVEDITSGAGVAKGTFYHYFKSKEDLIRDLAFSQIQDLFAETIKMDGPPEKKLAFYFGCLMKDAQITGSIWSASGCVPSAIRNRFPTVPLISMTAINVYHRS